MKKKLLVLSIISAVLAVVGLVLAFVAFKTGGADFGTRIIGTFKGLFAFQTMIGAKDWLSLGISAVIFDLVDPLDCFLDHSFDQTHRQESPAMDRG
jgi:hypothetical protein